MTTTPDAVRQIASLPLPLVMLKPGQIIAAANPAAEQFLGQSARRLVGRKLAEVLTFDEPYLKARFEHCDAPVSARQIRAALADGSRHELDMHLAPVVDEQGWLLLMLGESQPTEPQGRGDGTLRAPDILAHEIKNPLAGIRGAAQLLARKVGEGDKALTSLIAQEVDRIASLIDQMQTLSQRTVAELKPCNLHEVLRRASAVLTAADGAVVAFVEEFDPSIPPVLANEDGLVQVLINLLANARDACRAGSQPQIVLRTRFNSGMQFYSDGKALRLPVEVRISDNGPGVDPNLQDQIFEPFVTSKKTGQGLGLALVRKLVREMNGRVQYERDARQGWTHFRLHLPLAEERLQKDAKP